MCEIRAGVATVIFNALKSHGMCTNCYTLGPNELRMTPTTSLGWFYRERHDRCANVIRIIGQLLVSLMRYDI